MKILFLTHRMPYPPDRGDRIRSYHMLRHLAENHDVWLASVNDESPSAEAKLHLGALCNDFAIYPISNFGRTGRAIKSLACGRSATEGFFWQPKLAQVVRRWNLNHSFDAAVCYCSAMFRYTQLTDVVQTPVVVDLVDVDSQKWNECAAASKFPRRILHRNESRRVRALEREIAVKAAAVTLVSREEESLYRGIAGDSDTIAVPNGVDLEYFTPYHNPAKVEANTCCFIGVLNYQPNAHGLQWFVKHVWPQVRAAVPGARFLIVGKSPNRIVKRLISTPGVELYADVPDVRPFLRRSAVAIVPLQIARGVQNKVLEAMAMGKAVIASPAALQSIHAVRGRDLIAANDDIEWFGALMSCFADPAGVEELGLHARAYVETCHNWKSCLQPFNELLQMVIGSSPEPTSTQFFGGRRLAPESVDNGAAASSFVEV